MKPILLFFLMIYSSFTFSQSLQKQIAGSLDTLAELYPREHVYLHTDKDQYGAGETIWFKCYVAHDNKPSFLSKVIYVELVNESNKLVEKRMYKVENGTAAGDIQLKATLSAGTYVINAYTMWMLNFSGNIFSKHLYVVNTGLKKPVSSSQNFTVQFFPEGGKLLNGVESNLAFKATGGNGLPVDISGEIVDSRNNPVSKFQSIHNGIGVVKINPAAGEKYTAVATFNGTKKSFQLPQPASEGVSLVVTNNNPGKTFVRVDRAETNKALYNELVVVAVLNDKLAYINNLNIDERLDAVSISKKNFPAGILHILVFDKNGVLLATRLAFVNNGLSQGSKIKPGSTNNNISEYSLDLTGLTKPEVSAAVLLADQTNPAAENILSGLLLSNEVDGYVHKPAGYFRDTSATTTKEMDLLMLTSTSNKIDYGKIINKKFPVLTRLVESGISITGRAVKPGTNTEIKTGRINIWVKGEDSTSIVSEAQLNDKGYFMIPGLDFKKSAKILYQGTNTKKEAALVEVKIFPSFFDTLKSPHAKPLVDLNPYYDNTSAAIAEKMLGNIATEQASKGKVLQEIKITGKKRTAIDSLNQLYASDLFQISDHTFAPDSNVHYFDIWQLIRARIPGLAINKTDTGTQVNFSRYAGLNVFGEGENSSIQFFLNEVPVPVDIIEFLDPNDVALIKSFSGNTGIALGATRGAIAIYTIKGKASRDWRSKGFESIDQSGYSVAQIFYSAANNAADSVQKEGATVLWAADVKVGKNNNGRIRFVKKSSDQKIRIILQGFDAEGNLIFEEKTD